MIQKARGGGSITTEYMQILRQEVKNSRLTLKEQVQVTDCVWNSDKSVWDIVFSDSSVASFEYIWLGTGSVLDIQKEPCMQKMLQQYPIDVVGGLPVLNDELEASGDVAGLHFMSGLSALAVGPIAGNLMGGRICAERISEAILRDWGDRSGDGTSLEERPQLDTLADMAANFCNYWDYLRTIES